MDSTVPAFHFQFDVTVEDYRRAMEVSTLDTPQELVGLNQLRKNRRTIMTTCVVFILAIFVVLSPVITLPVNAKVSLVLFFGLLAYLCGHTAFGMRNLRKSYRKMSLKVAKVIAVAETETARHVEGPTEASIDSRGLEAHGPYGSAFWNWSGVTSVREYADTIIVDRIDGQFFWLPKRVFQSVAEEQRYVDFVRNQIAEQGYQEPAAGAAC